MENIFSEIVPILIIWMVSLLFIFFLMFVAMRKDNRRYNNPSFLKKITPISLATAIGSLAIIKLFALLIMPLSKYAAHTMVFIAPLLIIFTYLPSWRTPKHNQKEAVKIMYAHRIPLSEINETIADKFPGVPQEKIRIYSESENSETLCFLPYETEYAEREDNFLAELYPYPSLAQAINIAKVKDFEMKKTRIFFFRGILHFTIERK